LEAEGMPEREISSLDRFLVRHAPAALDMVRTRVLGIIGSIYSAVGLGALGVGLIGALVGSGAVFIAIPGAMFAGTGGLMLWLRGLFQRQIPPDYAAPAELTPEAKALVYSLIRHLFGWPMGPRFKHAVWRRRMADRNLLSLMRDRRSADALTPVAFRLLDDAARECNRIHGILSLDPSAASTSQKLAPDVRAAVAETMSDLLHTAALLERTPECAAAMEPEAEQRVQELHELADRVEQLHAAAEAAQVERPTRLQALLHDLRAEQSARAELSATAGEEAPALQQLRLGSSGEGGGG
jgi:hypothetical protein